MSYELQDVYSQLIEPTPIFKRKSKFKKRMFAKVKKEKEEEEQPPDDEKSSEGVHRHLDPKLTGKRPPVRKNSFEMLDRERQCFQLSEKGNLWIVLALLAGICFAFNNFFLGQLSP